MTQETIDRFAIPMEDARPVVLEGTVVAEHTWQVQRKGARYSESPTMLGRARLMEGHDGSIGYLVEFEQQPGQWAWNRSAVWASWDKIPMGSAPALLKHLLRLAGRGDETYQRLDAGPYTATVERESGPDLQFAGTALGGGRAYYHGTLLSGWCGGPFPVEVFALDAGGYRLVYHTSRYADGSGGDRDLAWTDCASAAEVYAQLVWRHGKDLGDYYDYSGNRYPEADERIRPLLEQLAAADSAFNCVAYVVQGGPDPVLDLWKQERVVWRTKQQEMAEQRQKEREEEERLHAEAQARYAEEERIRQEEWARQAEENERLLAEQMTQAKPRQPSIEQRARDILTAGLESRNEMVRVQAAMAIYLGDRIDHIEASCGAC